LRGAGRALKIVARKETTVQPAAKEQVALRRMLRGHFLQSLVLIAGVLWLGMQSLLARGAETVHFRSGDGQTDLIGYVFRPSGPGPHAAVVMLHGRGGAYSSLARGIYNADTLSKRHEFWGEFWAGKGYIALLVDSFGPRGYWQGFPKSSYDDRPSAVSEQTVRPLDAYGALAYLRKRSDVVRDRIGLQGWSNGAMTALVTVSSRAPGVSNPSPASAFRAALAFYPGCGMEAIQGSYVPYAPIQMFVGTDDAEVSSKRCVTWEKRVQAAGGSIDLIVYDGAEHDFDDPSASRQRNESNAAATRDAVRRAEEFFGRNLK
jgi:Dienelactone hydrolase and related enzymes